MTPPRIQQRSLIQLGLIQGKGSPLGCLGKPSTGPGTHPLDQFKVLCFQGENMKIHSKFTSSTTAAKLQVCFFEVSCLCRTSVLLRAYWDNLEANLQNQTNTSLLRVNSRPNEKELQTSGLLKISENAHSASCHFTIPACDLSCCLYLLGLVVVEIQKWREKMESHDK